MGEGIVAPFAGIIRIRFNGSAALPRHPLSLRQSPAVIDPGNETGLAPRYGEARTIGRRRQVAYEQ